MTMALSFQSTSFDIIDRNNQPWLRVFQIGRALGYARPEAAISKIYNAHADEFTSSMTQVVTLDTPGGPQETRIFSLRGCHLLAMFSRTPVAKAFRVWVLDVLETLNKAQPLTNYQQLTPSTAGDRAPLRAIVHAWSQVCGQAHSALWPQVKAHFQLSRIDDLPVEWIPDALAFVQSKIDSSPKALPVAAPYMPYDFEQAMQVTGSVAARASSLGMNLYDELKTMSEEAERSFSRTSQARMAGQFDFFLSDCEQNMKRLSNVVFEASLAYSAQAAAMKKMAQLMLRAEK